MPVFHLFPSAFFFISGLILLLKDFCHIRSPPVLLSHGFFSLQLGQPLLWQLVDAGAGQVQVEDGGGSHDKQSEVRAQNTPSPAALPNFNLDKLTEKVWPSDYVLIFLWVSRTERYDNVLILIVLSIKLTELSLVLVPVWRSYLALWSAGHWRTRQINHTKLVASRCSEDLGKIILVKLRFKGWVLRPSDCCTIHCFIVGRWSMMILVV